MLNDKSLLFGGNLVALVAIVFGLLLPQPQAVSDTSMIASKAASQALYQMSPLDITGLLQEIRKKPFLERLGIISAQAKGTPYFLGPLGEGPDSPYDKKPLIDLKRVDCVTFSEQTLALAMSQTYEEALQRLQKIRYKGGKIGIEYRNHYIMADWLPNNHQWVQNVTQEVGKPYTQSVTRTISHQSLFSNLNYPGLKAIEPDRKVTIQYVPKAHLGTIASRLKTGDMAVFIQDYPGIFASHMGFMIRTQSGQWVFRNATSIGPKKVVDLPYSELVAYLLKSKRNLGLSFIRPLNK